MLRTEKNREIKMPSKISIEIQLPDNFPEKYKKAAIRAADLCSVKKHIENSRAFETYVTTLASYFSQEATEYAGRRSPRGMPGSLYGPYQSKGVSRNPMN
jgi:hypothetical protein